MHQPKGTPTHRQAIQRVAIMIAAVAVVLTAAACGRATEADINRALGITPTPTRSAEEIAAATEAAEARIATREAAAAAGEDTTETDAEDLLAFGNPVQGGTVWLQNCLACHRAGSAGGNILDGSVEVDLAPAAFIALVREGQNHPSPPGPFTAQRISDQSLAHVYAHIRQQRGEE